MYTTLLCLGAPRRVVNRFYYLLRNPSWREAVEEPFLLFSIVYDELYHLVDQLAWGLADCFRPMEKGTLDRARNTNEVFHVSSDFISLHNISKHCIYMNEAVEAATQTLDNMMAHLITKSGNSTSTTISSLQYRKTMFQSTQLRLRSLEKRMANIISLSFNLVTQQDSRVMQNDSSAMKAIAVMTLIFLPATGISSIFSTPFFSVTFDEPENRMLKVAACFWIFWVVTVPLTALIFLLWLWIYRQAKEKRGGSKSRQWDWMWQWRKRAQSHSNSEQKQP